MIEELRRSTSSASGRAFALPDTVRDPRVRLMYDYWAGKCMPGRLPGRRDIDPLEMLPFLPYVIMFDVERRDPDYLFRYRLVGTEVVELFGYDPTGRYLHETNIADRYPASYRRLASVVDTKQPIYAVLPVAWPNRDNVEFENLTLPMATDGVTVDLLIGVRCGLTAKHEPVR